MDEVLHTCPPLPPPIETGLDTPWTSTLVRVVRKQLGWSQVTLGKHAGLSERTIRIIERCEKPVLEQTLRDVVSALNYGMQRDMQLILDFEPLRPSDVCTLSDGMGHARPGPRDFLEGKRAYMQLARRELDHQTA